MFLITDPFTGSAYALVIKTPIPSAFFLSQPTLCTIGLIVVENQGTDKATVCNWDGAANAGVCRSDPVGSGQPQAGQSCDPEHTWQTSGSVSKHTDSGNGNLLCTLWSPHSHSCWAGALGWWSSHEVGIRPALSMTEEWKQRPRREGQTPFPVAAMYDWLAGIENVELSPESCLLRANVTLIFLCLSCPGAN